MLHFFDEVIHDRKRAGKVFHVAGPRGVGRREKNPLATGRPASIFEIKALVERILKKSVYFRLDDSFGNHENMTFHHAALAHGWNPIGLSAGIRLLSMDAGQEGMAFSP